MSDQKWPHTLKAGSLAFLDSFSGLIPVKVLKIEAKPEPLHPQPRLVVHYEVTETLGAYRKGDQDTSSPRQVVPRGAVHRREFSTTIRPYNVVVTA